MNEILIQSLRVSTLIGVPDDERACPQEVEIDIRMRPPTAFERMEDRIDRTIDYAAVCQRIEKLSLDRPRCLLETLAVDIVKCLKSEFGAAGVAVEIRKFILPRTRHVAVRHVEGFPSQAAG